MADIDSDVSWSEFDEEDVEIEDEHLTYCSIEGMLRLASDEAQYLVHVIKDDPKTVEEVSQAFQKLVSSRSSDSVEYMASISLYIASLRRYMQNRGFH